MEGVCLNDGINHRIGAPIVDRGGWNTESTAKNAYGFRGTSLYAFAKSALDFIRGKPA